MTTRIASGSALDIKAMSVALFARTITAPNMINNLTGPAPQQKGAEAKLKGQTSADMPVVRVTDLSKSAGSSVSVDAFDTINGKPLMGDVDAEGKGEGLSSSSMDIKIDLTSKPVDAGAKMTNQRTVHNLRGIAMSQLVNYFPRLATQRMIVHAAGARGSHSSSDWIVPLATDADFADIMINTVKAPTYNRHLVVDSTNILVQGGQQLGSIDSADVWTLDQIDALALHLKTAKIKMQKVRIKDDPAAADDGLLGVLYLTPAQMHQITTQNSGRNWTDMVKNAWTRKSAGSKHPLFTGEVGMWKGLLVKELPDTFIRFAAGESTNIVTEANRYTATESAQAVNAGLAAGYAVERAILLGAQAIGSVFGKNQASEYYFAWHERKYNFDRSLEVLGDSMAGMAKLRFTFDDGAGNKEPTDNGVYVIDSAVKL